MKKILLAMLLVLLIPFAMAASDNATTSNETTGMSTSYGAEARLLQLESAIDRAITHGNAVIAASNATNATNVTDLQDIVAQLESLKTAVAAVNPNSTDVEAQFVALKKEAQDLVSQFREIAQVKLTKEQRDVLRAEMKTLRVADQEKFKQLIQTKVCKHHSKVAERVLTDMNETNTELVNSVASCNMSWSDARSELKTKFSELNESGKNQVRQHIKEDMAKGRVRALQMQEKAFEHRMQVRDKIYNMTMNRIHNDTRRAQFEQRWGDKNQGLEAKHEQRQNKFSTEPGSSNQPNGNYENETALEVEDTRGHQGNENEGSDDNSSEESDDEGDED